MYTPMCCVEIWGLTYDVEYSSPSVARLVDICIPHAIVWGFVGLFVCVILVLPYVFVMGVYMERKTHDRQFVGLCIMG